MTMDARGIITGGRSSSPREWQHTVLKPSYELTWHHTVSLNTLTAGWNWMREGEHWEAMRLYLDCAGMSNIDNVIHELQTGNVQDRDALMTAIQWPSWNMMEGPKSRTDDPGTRLEMWPVRFMSANHRETMQAAQQVHMVFSSLPRGAPEDQEYGRKIVNVLKHNRQNLRKKGPITMYPKMWLEEVSGRAHAHGTTFKREPKFSRVI